MGDIHGPIIPKEITAQEIKYCAALWVFSFMCVCMVFVMLI